MEEVNLRAKKLTLLGTYWRNHRRTKALGYVYFVTKLENKSLKKDKEEGEIDLLWLAEEKIEELISKGEVIEDNMLASWSICKSKKKQLT